MLEHTEVDLVGSLARASRAGRGRLAGEAVMTVGPRHDPLQLWNPNVGFPKNKFIVRAISADAVRDGSVPLVHTSPVRSLPEHRVTVNCHEYRQGLRGVNGGRNNTVGSCRQPEAWDSTTEQVPFEECELFAEVVLGAAEGGFEEARGGGDRARLARPLGQKGEPGEVDDQGGG